MTTAPQAAASLTQDQINTLWEMFGRAEALKGMAREHRREVDRLIDAAQDIEKEAEELFDKMERFYAILPDPID